MSRATTTFARWAAATAMIVAVSVGCRAAPNPAPGTGAKEAAQAFAEAIVAKDWPRAYALLSAESNGKIGADQFVWLAQQYRAGLGFEPFTAHVTACEEHGREAIAHVTLTGKGPHRSRFKDALTLRSVGADWGVVLAANFGRPR